MEWTWNNEIKVTSSKARNGHQESVWSLAHLAVARFDDAFEMKTIYKSKAPRYRVLYEVNSNLVHAVKPGRK